MSELPGDTPSGFQIEPATLYVVSTPIGNLEDATPRSIHCLSQVDQIACEDTRVTGKLLKLLGIPEKPLISYRDENEKILSDTLADSIAAGTSLALVSDAGTPTCSDPGFRLIRACRRAGLPVIPIPGITASATALSVSGLPTDGHLFVGFLPPKASARQRFLESHKEFPYTLVLYESTHRIEKLLDDILAVLGPDRVIHMAREMTKRHETYLTGSVATVMAEMKTRSKKGEFVVCIARQGFAL